MMLLMLGFGILLGYQTFLLRRENAGRRERVFAFAVTGLVFVFAALAMHWPEGVNPNRAIRLVFGPIQRWIEAK
ncbi:hypothetical protein [Cohnella sp. GCM10012308]|uniref:hypothetical protein n=1 Tax=Cohnella sp. GCM10012308 TaxID=3317329 RepID=UPI003615F11A